MEAAKACLASAGLSAIEVAAEVEVVGVMGLDQLLDFAGVMMGVRNYLEAGDVAGAAAALRKGLAAARGQARGQQQE